MQHRCLLPAQIATEDGVLRTTLPASTPVEMVPDASNVFVARELGVKVRRVDAERSLTLDIGGNDVPIVGWKETKKAEDAVC